MKTAKQIIVKARLNGELVYQRCHKGYLSDEGMDIAARNSKREFELAGYTVTMEHTTSYLYDEKAARTTCSCCGAPCSEWGNCDLCRPRICTQEGHDYIYDRTNRRHYCKNCDQEPSPDWYDIFTN